MPVPCERASAAEEGEALRCFLSIKNTFPRRVAEARGQSFALRALSPLSA